MIDPSSIDINSLPWMPLTEKSVFPEQPAVYLAIDRHGAVQYVGQSVNPQKRWAHHHHCKSLLELGEVRIAYVFVDYEHLLPTEAGLIKKFTPPLNTAGTFSRAADFSRKGNAVAIVEKLPEDGRYRSQKFLSIICKFMGKSVPPNTFRSWRRRIGIKIGSDNCYSKRDICHMLECLEFRAKGYTTDQFLAYKAGEFIPAP